MTEIEKLLALIEKLASVRDGERAAGDRAKAAGDSFGATEKYVRALAFADAINIAAETLAPELKEESS